LVEHRIIGSGFYLMHWSLPAIPISCQVGSHMSYFNVLQLTFKQIGWYLNFNACFEKDLNC